MAFGAGETKPYQSMHCFQRKKPAAQVAGQTLPDATPPVGKIHPFSKITVTFEPLQRIRCHSRFKYLKNVNIEAQFLTVFLVNG